MALNIQDYIRPGKHAHLVGIGGVSMSPLAEVLHGAGVTVTAWMEAYWGSGVGVGVGSGVGSGSVMGSGSTGTTY